MTGEVVIQDGASGWVSVATGVSLSAATFAQVHATNTIAALMAATEEDYEVFDVQIQVTAGTPAENEALQVHLRPKPDGVNEAVAPSGSYQPHYLGSVVLDNTTGFYNAFGLSNIDKLGTFYLKTASALTVSMSIRMRSQNAAA